VFAGPLQAGTPVIVYLALPHAVLAAAVDALAAVGLPAGSRLVVEKPFGESQETARRLNQKVLAVVPEDHVFRVDHFLAKQTVYNVLGLRFANRIFEPLWNALHVERVDIVGTRRSRWRAGRATTTRPARCRTCCRTTCCS
jgi:glucose-6-phosphate 1-dehydrogenase